MSRQQQPADRLSAPQPFLFAFVVPTQGRPIEGAFSPSQDVWTVVDDDGHVPLIRLSYALTYTHTATKVWNESNDRD